MMKRLSVIVLLAFAATTQAESLTVKYCPGETDTPSSIKAKLSRMGTDELAVVGTRQQQSQLEIHEGDTMDVDTRLLGNIPVVTSISYAVEGDCHLAIYSY